MKGEGDKALVSVGLLVMGAVLGMGVNKHVVNGIEFVVVWFAVGGLGLGVDMRLGMKDGVGAVCGERSGFGFVLIIGMREMGATIGVAVMGIVVLSGYSGQL